MSRTPTPAAPGPESRAPLASAHWTFETAADCVRRLDWPRAREAYECLSRRHPDHAELHCNLGLIVQSLGDTSSALHHFSEAVRLQPEAARPHLLRGDLHKAAHRYDVALDDYDAALNGGDLGAPDAQAHLHANRGTTLQALGRHDDALRSIDQALRCDPGTPGAHYNRGNILRSLGRHEEAVGSFDQALKLDAADIQARFNRGLSLGSLGRWGEALEDADAVILRAPDHARAHSARGDWLKNLGQRTEALAAYDAALALDGEAQAAHLNRGNTLREMGRAEEALQAYDEAVRRQPADWEAHYNRGIALHDLRRIPQALESYSLARRLAPQEDRIEWNEALALLMSQRWHEGWLAYESRWRLNPPDPALLQQAGRRWTGAQDPSGKRMLLVAEQGLGDTLQFCRYAPLVVALGAEPTLMAPESLRGLLQSLGPQVRVVAELAPGERFDFHCPLMSLPLALQQFDPHQSGARPYLLANQALVEGLLRRHPRSPRLRVGLAWSGNPRNQNDAHRSMRLAQLVQALPAVV